VSGRKRTSESVLLGRVRMAVGVFASVAVIGSFLINHTDPPIALLTFAGVCLGFERVVTGELSRRRQPDDDDHPASGTPVTPPALPPDDYGIPDHGRSDRRRVPRLWHRAAYGV
jgi:hypothetical protein